MRSFIDRSPFALVATADRDGHGDVSPRGDPAGSFVRILDDSTLLLPDRTGNHLVDTLRNILVNADVAMALAIPGEPDVLHVRARARITADAALLAPSAVKNKAPKVGVLLDLQDAHFARGTLRNLWVRESLVDPADFPTMGQMILDQVNPGGRVLNRVGSAIFDLASSYHKKRRLY